jgi:NifU-like protein involved in Fe-S cluster formation
VYSQQVLDHFERPRNMGLLPDANATGIVGAPACGDVMKLQLKIGPVDGVETIVDVKAKVFGCGSAIAATSYLTELIKGRPVAEAAAITDRQIARALDLPPVKVYCSVLAEGALQAALRDYRARKGAAEAVAAAPAPTAAPARA